MQSNNENTQRVQKEVDMLLSMDMDKHEALEELLETCSLVSLSESLLKIYMLSMPDDSQAGIGEEDIDNLYALYRFLLLMMAR